MTPESGAVPVIERTPDAAPADRYSDWTRTSRRTFLDAARRGVWENREFCVIVALYMFAGWLAARVLSAEDLFGLSFYSKSMGVAALFTTMIAGIAYVLRMLRDRRRHPIRRIAHQARTDWLTAERASIALPVLVLLPVFGSVFSSLKSMIPLMHPYTWDKAFMAWDAALHGGTHPWRLLQPLLGYPLVTSGVNIAYNVWFLVVFGVFFWQAVSLADLRLRKQYFLTFVLSWILLGSVAATLLASAGPCFVGRMGVAGGADVYGPLMAYLRSVDVVYPVWSLAVQDKLWELFLAGRSGSGSGISAMPSMHVSSAFLLALVGWRRSRALGIALSVFCLLILLGSVHLGWHYAIDGYAGIAGTLLLWWLVGLYVKREPGSATPDDRGAVRAAGTARPGD